MLPLPNFLCVLGAAYCLLGAIVVGRALKPGCRVCLHRHSFPNREGSHPSDAAKSSCLGK
jgi:hypothetical protein